MALAHFFSDTTEHDLYANMHLKIYAFVILRVYCTWHKHLLLLQVTSVVEAKVTSSSELNKYHSYVNELGKVICLLLNVSGRLARAENAVMSLEEDASAIDKVRARRVCWNVESVLSVLVTLSCRLQRAVTAKRDELLKKLDDAKELKDGIDRRSDCVTQFLRKHLSQGEFDDYEHFIKMKSKLTVDQQDVEDKLKLGEELLAQLRKSSAPTPP